MEPSPVRSTSNRVLATLAAATVLGSSLAACADGENSPQNSKAISSSRASSAGQAGGDCTPATSRDGLSLPDKSCAQGKTFQAVVDTSQGEFTLELDGTKAPQTVASFIQLSGAYYANTSCHRLVPDFVLQCGDPTGTGTGGPGYTYGLENAPKDDQYPRGTLAMARQGNNGDSNGGQFFVTLKDVPIPSDSAGGYTIFGKVLSGMDVMDRVAAGGVAEDGTAPKTPVTIKKITVTEKKA
nr:peptidylprolyl isomerase [Yimella sp. cx-51]